MNVRNFVSVIALAGAVLSESSMWAQEVVTPTATNRIVHWLNGKSLPRIDIVQAEAYVERQQRRPEALLAACQASGNRVFLREAMDKYPHDRRVAMAGAFQSTSTEATGGTEEKRRWLDAFKKAAPDNALAHYLSARDNFKSGQAELAEKEVEAGANKPVRDYALDFIENAQDAYVSAGYSEAEAIALAMGSLLMPHFAQLRDLGAELAKRGNHYRNSGDTASADKMLHAAMRIGAQLDSTNSLTILQSLVGVAIQQSALKTLEPAAALGDSGRTVQSETDRLFVRRNELRTIANDFNRRFVTMSDQEIGDYFNQQKRLGEEAANRRSHARGN